MTGTWLGLLLKPILGLLIVVGVFGTAILLTKLLRPIFPKGRLKEWLFRDRGSHDSGKPTTPANGRQDDLPVIRWDSRQD